MIKIKINNKQANKQILSVLSELYPYIPYSTFQKVLRKKDIKVNNMRITDNIVVKTNDVIDIYYDYKLKIIYEDENILIVYKPVQLEVISENQEESSLHKIVENYLNNTFCYYFV